MNTNDTNRDELVKRYEELKEAFVAINKTAFEYEKSVVEEFLASNGFDKITFIDRFSATNKFFISVWRDEKDKEYTLDIDIRFERDWRNPDRSKSNARVIELNCCSFGSFLKRESGKRNYYLIVGKLCEKMDELEKKFSDFNWDEFDELQSKFDNAKSALESYDATVKNKEFAEKKEKALAKLSVGTKIFIGMKNTYDGEKGEFVKVPDIRTVEKMGNKTINLSGMWKRMKKDDVCKYIATEQWKVN